jgi:hypothetical protein
MIQLVRRAGTKVGLIGVLMLLIEVEVVKLMAVWEGLNELVGV